MRKNKFRAFADQEMFYNVRVGGTDETVPTYWNGSDWIHLESSLCEVMQYTGLNDTNNKEIYEGDIVETDKGYLIVEFGKDGMYIGRKEHYTYKLYDFIYLGYCYVIGNIYQNKNLLGGN
jgi:uncharacterized phage protein (TIGR01671 family)